MISQTRYPISRERTGIASGPGESQSTANLPSRFESRFVTAVLFFGTGAFSAFNIDPSGTVSPQEDLFSRTIWIAIYAVLFCLIAKRAKAIWVFFLSQGWLVGLLVWVFASILWSDAPEITIRRAIALFATTMFGVYMAERFTLKQQMNMLLVALSLVAFLSLLAGLLLPKIAIMNGFDTAGCWRGIVSHKNILGRLMAMAVALCFISTGSKTQRMFVLPLGVLMLALSKSASAILDSAILLMCLPCIWLLRQSRRVLITGAALSSLLVLSFISYAYGHAEQIIAAILNQFGKSSTLNGRGPLWLLCLRYISERPWLGYGYNAFWLGADGQYSSQIWKILHWEAPHAHNGFLEVCLDTGVIGLALFLCVYIVALVQSIKTLRHTRTRESMWLVTFLIFIFAASLSESTVPSVNNVFWITFVSVIYSAYRLTKSLPDSRAAHRTKAKAGGVA